MYFDFHHILREEGEKDNKICSNTMDRLISWKIRNDITQMWAKREAAAEAAEREKSGPPAAAPTKK
jgi:hypothetical protein